MQIKTEWSIVFTNDNTDKNIKPQRIEQNDKIKLVMKNGEILIGSYDFSDLSRVYINREGGDLEVIFEQVKEIYLVY